MDWVRLFHETPTDPKWRVIAKRSGQRIGDVIAVWNFVLCNASSNTVKRGVTRNLVTEDVAAALDLNDADVTAILTAMEGKVIKNGALLGWEKRNPIKEDNSTERVKRWRETQRNAQKRPELDTESEKIQIKKEVERASAPLPKGTRWPPDKLVPKEWQTDADIWRHEHGLPRIDLAYEAERFQNYWASRSRDAARLDWKKTWMNWATDKEKTGHGRARTSGKSHDDTWRGISDFVGEDREDPGGDATGGSQSPAAGAAPRPLPAPGDGKTDQQGGVGPPPRTPGTGLRIAAIERGGDDGEIPTLLRGFRSSA